MPLDSRHLQVKCGTAVPSESRCEASDVVTADTRLRCCDRNQANECALLNPLGNNQHSVCGSLVHPAGGLDVVPITLDPLNGGVDDMDLAAAALECAMQGARLCTADELMAKVCCGTGAPRRAHGPAPPANAASV